MYPDIQTSMLLEAGHLGTRGEAAHLGQILSLFEAHGAR